jgi:putative oxidoreductase
MIQSFYAFSDWGLLILRATLGLILLFHGWPKIKNLKNTAGDFEMMGFKPGIFWGTLFTFVEFFGGLAIIFGTFTQLVAFIVAIQFIVILLKVKRGQSFAGGVEFDLLILAVAFAIFTLGAGALSFDSIYAPLF